MRNVDTMTTLNSGTSGANQSWIMTNATIHQTQATKAISPSSTPSGSSYTNSNIALTNDNLTYLYMNQSSATSLVKGAAGDLLMTGCNVNTPFSPDILLHNFPRNYNDNFNDVYGIDVTVAGSCVNQPVDQVRFKQVSTVYDYTDGWGIITTPVGKYEVLRIKRIDYAVDTTWYKLFSFSNWTMAGTKLDTTFSYSWVSKEGKLAIAELANDSNDIPKKFTWSLIEPLKAGITSSNNLNCNGVCGGKATVSAQGLYTPYSYLWTSGEATASATGLCEGANSVTVTDNIGNTKVVSVTLTGPAALSVSASSTNASSATATDGTASATGTGGVSPYTYMWNNGAVTQNISSLLTGNYSVTITDANGCTATNSVLVGFTVGLNSNNSKGSCQLIAFPNPTSEKIYFSGLKLNDVIKIFDARGNILGNFSLNPATPSVNVSNFIGGIYFYQVVNKEGRLEGKGKFSVEK